MSSLAEQILEFLSLPQNVEGVDRVKIADYVGSDKTSVNSTLYELEKKCKVEHISVSPPKWKLKGISRAAVEQPEPAGKRFHKSESASVSDSKETSAMKQTRSPNDGVRLTSTQSADSVTNSQRLSEDKLAFSTSDAASCPVGGIMAPVNLAPVLTQQESDLLTTGQDYEYVLCKNVSSMTISHSDTGISNYGSPGFAELSPVVGNKAEEESRVIEVLRKANGKPVPRKDIQKQMGANKKRANQLLDSLRDQGKVIKVKNEPPEWTLTQSCQVNATLMDPSDNLKKSLNNTLTMPVVDLIPLKKSLNNTLTMPVVDLIKESATKVAMIISPTTQGTGFRVGARYLMTAAHVVTEIIAEYPSDAGGGMSLNKEKLCDESVYAVFEFHETLGQPSNRWFFDNWFWINEEHDVALLMLRADQSSVGSLPGHLGDIIEFSRKPSRHETVILIGHQDKKQKEFDFKGKAYVPDFASLDKQLFQEAEAKRSDLIFYRTRLEHGSSGAPIFMSRGDSLFLVGIHLKSYPSREVVADQAKRGARVRQFQAGASMVAVRRCLAEIYGEDVVTDMLGLKATGSNGAGLSPPGAY